MKTIITVIIILIVLVIFSLIIIIPTILHPYPQDATYPQEPSYTQSPYNRVAFEYEGIEFRQTHKDPWGFIYWFEYEGKRYDVLYRPNVTESLDIPQILIDDIHAAPFVTIAQNREKLSPDITTLWSPLRNIKGYSIQEALYNSTEEYIHACSEADKDNIVLTFVIDHNEAPNILYEDYCAVFSFNYNSGPFVRDAFVYRLLGIV